MTSASQPSKGLHIALWIVQVLLAAMFTMSGTMKLITPIEVLGAQMDWVKEMPFLIHFIGVSEIAGSLGLLLPSILRIKPVLTAWAAIGLLTIMVLAAALHLSRGEWGSVAGNIVFGAMASFVAWGRMKKAVIAPRA